MVNRYIATLNRLLTEVSLPVPTNLRADQMLTVELLTGVTAAVAVIQTTLNDTEEERAQYQSTATQALAQVVALQGQVVALEEQLLDAVTLGTADADAIAGDIVLGKTAYVNGVKIVGTRE